MLWIALAVAAGINARLQQRPGNGSIMKQMITVNINK